MISLQFFTKRLFGVVNPRLDGARFQAKDLGNLLMRKILQEAQCQYLSVIRVELTQGLVDASHVLIGEYRLVLLSDQLQVLSGQFDKRVPDPNGTSISLKFRLVNVFWRSIAVHSDRSVSWGVSSRRAARYDPVCR